MVASVKRNMHWSLLELASVMVFSMETLWCFSQKICSFVDIAEIVNKMIKLVNKYINNLQQNWQIP